MKTILRLQLGSLLALFALGLPAAPRTLAAPSVVPFIVNSTLDVVDQTPADGFCRTDPLGPAAGACTLRAAVMEANAAGGPAVTIIVPSGMYTLIIPRDPADGPANGDLNLTTPAGGNAPVISIVGAGAANRSTRRR